MLFVYLPGKLQTFERSGEEVPSWEIGTQGVQTTCVVRGYYCLVVAGGFLGMVFCDTRFCTVLWHLIGEIYEDEQMHCFKDRDYPCAIPQLRSREKNCKTQRKRGRDHIIFTRERYSSLLCNLT